MTSISLFLSFFVYSYFNYSILIISNLHKCNIRCIENCVICKIFDEILALKNVMTSFLK